MRSQISIRLVVSSFVGLGWGLTAQAQLIPDTTLGSESTLISPSQMIRGLPSDRIDGGAHRGGNLFHSFQEFNVEAGRGIYFSNPAGITNILTRVTGGQASSILGRLGVLGDANLLLLNPNGILFGANASLDITGSFLATTASSIQLGNAGLFSASHPQTSTLLAVQPGALFLTALSNQAITNRASLAAGNDLTLVAARLDLQGQLQAGGNLTLRATDTLQIRDTLATPFLARSGGDMQLQGDRAIDILALNHLSQTPFVSGGHLTLISDGAISADAHFTSGGNLAVRTLSGQRANLVSLYDPIITVGGNFDVGNYTGPSLEVIAVGDITYGAVDINAIDPTVHPTNPAFFLTAGGSITGTGGVITSVAGGGLLVNFQSFGDINIQQIFTQGGSLTLNSTNGSITSNGNQLDTFNGGGNSGDLTITAQGNITTGDLVTVASNTAGQIQVTSINGSISAGSALSLSFSGAGSGGNVQLSARNSVTLTGEINALSIGGGDGGSIAVTATTGSISTGGQVNAFSLSGGNGGAISLTAAGNISTGGQVINFGQAGSGGSINLTSTNGSITTSDNVAAFSIAGGSGGDVLLSAPNGSITTQGDILAFGLDGNAGTLTAQARDTITTTGEISVFSTNGDGGTVIATSTNGGILTGSNIGVFSTTNGNGGIIQLTAGNGGISAREVNAFAQGSGAAGGLIEMSATNGDVVAERLNAFSDLGNAGAIAVNVTRGSLIVGNVSTLSSTGNGGSINLAVQDGNLTAGNVVSLSDTGNGGAIALSTHNGNLTTTNDIVSSVIVGTGTAGAITLSAINGNVTIPRAVASGIEAGNGGVIQISTQNGDIQSGNIVATSKLGNGGAIRLSTVNGNVDLTGVLLSFTFDGVGNGADVTVNTTGGDIQLFDVFAFSTGGRSGSIQLNSTGNIVTSSLNATATQGAGSISVNAGETFSTRIFPDATRPVPVSAVISSDTLGAGRGGDVSIAARSIVLLDGTQVSASTHSSGQGGNVLLRGTTVELSGSVPQGVAPGTFAPAGIAGVTPGTFLGGYIPTGNATTFDPINATRILFPSGVFTQTTDGSTGNAGNIRIEASQLTVQNQAAIAATTFGTGSGGTITLVVPNGTITVDNGSVLSGTAPGSVGNSGAIAVEAQTLNVTNQGQFLASTSGSGRGGVLTIDATEAVRLTNNARLLAQASSSGSAGTLTISTRNLFVNASEISTTAAQSGGGQIAINADQILLRNSSAITSSVIDGAGGGGNISFASKLFIALEDSDILANARFGDGGRIIIDSTVFLADLFANVGRNPGGNFAQFRGNGRVDISASSEFGVSGIVSVPDFSFLQNSLSSLAADFVNPDQVVAGSCIARRNTQQGSFTVTGTGGLARTPYDTGLFYPYEVVSVQGTEPSETKTQPQTSPALSTTWQPGDRIQEAQAMVTTADGRILLAVETDAGAIAPAYNLPCSN